MNHATVRIAGYGDLLTVEEFAELTHKSLITVRRNCALGNLPAVKIGQRWYIPKSAIEDMFGCFGGAA